MKTCRSLKLGIQYKAKSFYRTWGVKIKRITFVSILTLCFLTMSILGASGESRRISRSFRLTFHVLPKVEMQIDTAKIDPNGLYLDSKNLLNVLSSVDDNMSVSRTFIDGRETVIVTKVCE